MTREEKDQIINSISEKLAAYPNFYITDTSNLTSDKTSALRRLCFSKGVKILVAKNSLIRKAMEKTGNAAYEPLFETLKGTTAIMFSETGNVPGKLIKEFRIKGDKPVLKSAYIDTAVFIGDNQLESLASIKSKNELIGDIIGLLQSPAKNVIGALQSSGGKLAGILKTLSEKPE
jgi:large subunit ribosomal protein L10